MALKPSWLDPLAKQKMAKSREEAAAGGGGIDPARALYGHLTKQGSYQQSRPTQVVDAGLLKEMARMGPMGSRKRSK